jgi:hypothetical protein
MTDNQLTIDAMYSGDKEMILESIRSETPILILNAIISGTQQKIRDEKYIDGLRMATLNNIALLNVKISELAVAALDVLGIEEYHGDDQRITSYIESAFNF